MVILLSIYGNHVIMDHEADIRKHIFHIYVNTYVSTMFFHSFCSLNFQIQLHLGHWKEYHDRPPSLSIDILGKRLLKHFATVK